MIIERIKATPAEVKRLSVYWREYQALEGKFLKSVARLEARMRAEMGDESLEFACSKFGGFELYFGIGFDRLGTSSKALVHDTELVLASEPK